MSLDKVLSISGKPGLYHLRARTRTGFIAESLTDGKKMPVSMRHNVSVLSEIAIYTLGGEVQLQEVFQNIYKKEDGGRAIDHKSSKDDLEAYFFDVLPNFDEDRVYASDIKKVVQWYNLLHEHDMLDFINDTEAKAEAETEAEDSESDASSSEEKTEA
ncbi:MAG: DUF5606 domain-containing protein [Leeuwenhoekiella sp.]